MALSQPMQVEAETAENAMPLVNLGWANNGLMWDGRTVDLEAASADAILSELHPNPSAILDILSEDSLYANLFAKAFEDGTITLENINKSLASFMRSIVSIDSKYDRYVKFGINELSQEEFRGFENGLFLGRRRLFPLSCILRCSLL